MRQQAPTTIARQLVCSVVSAVLAFTGPSDTRATPPPQAITTAAICDVLESPACFLGRRLRLTGVEMRNAFPHAGSTLMGISCTHPGVSMRLGDSAQTDSPADILRERNRLANEWPKEDVLRISSVPVIVTLVGRVEMRARRALATTCGPGDLTGHVGAYWDEEVPVVIVERFEDARRYVPAAAPAAAPAP